MPCKCKDCLINTRIVRTAQHDNQVIRPRGCWDRHPTVSRVRLCDVCRSPMAVVQAAILLFSVCVRSEALTFMCLYHGPEHVIVTGVQVWTVGGDVRTRTFHHKCCSFSRMVLPGWGQTLPTLDMAWLLNRWWMLSMLTRVQSLDLATNTRTRPHRQCDPKTRLPLFHTAAYVPRRYPLRVASVRSSNSSAPAEQKIPMPQNLRDDAMHTFHAVAKVFTHKVLHTAFASVDWYFVSISE
jgi:hypothetical protein